MLFYYVIHSRIYPQYSWSTLTIYGLRSTWNIYDLSATLNNYVLRSTLNNYGLRSTLKSTLKYKWFKVDLKIQMV